VAIPGQPTNRDSRGYPGWIPTVQLTRSAPPAATTSAVIRSRAAWLWSGWTAAGATGTGLMLASYGTSLPVARATATYVEVTLIGGRHVALRRSDVLLHAAGTSWAATRAKVVAEARRFQGLAYLWAGTSGFGFDCSGFTRWVYYQASGRDLLGAGNTDNQIAEMHRTTDPAPGDLAFFGSSTSSTDHVGIYIGHGEMINAFETGTRIQINQVADGGHLLGYWHF